MRLRRPGRAAAKVDWLCRPGDTLSAADYRAGMLARMTESDLQRNVVLYFRQALPVGSFVIAIPNQRSVGKMTEAERKRHLTLLVSVGMMIGATDLHFVWDRRLGSPGNEGVCYVELKRPVGAEKPTTKQLEFIAGMRAIGKVAGIAISQEQVEDLLIEAGAPLLFRLPRINVPTA